MDKAAGVMTVSELEAMLENRKVRAIELAKRRNELQKQLDEIDRELVKVMGTGRTVHRRRLRNGKSLRSHVLTILRKCKKGYSMAQLSDRILSSGYKSSSSNFRNVLYQCLYNTEGVTYDSTTGCYRLAPRP
ncbi:MULTISPECIES: hypothetical protein [unclassified Schlesneria]|uniref:hypothetical protein n=1 Tax=Schlesneria TaxID=656899 RepID=UPI002F15C103